MSPLRGFVLAKRIIETPSDELSQVASAAVRQLRYHGSRAARLNRETLDDEMMNGLFSADRWERTRLEGMAKFILLRGLVLFGGVVSLFLLVLQLRIEGRIRGLGLMSTPELAMLTHRLEIDAVVYGLAAGLVWGVLTWWLSEASYRRQKRRAKTVV
jgi:hypothetical protein